MFAMAKAFPRLQNLSGESVKLCLHNFTCRKADMVDLLSQQPNSADMRPPGPLVPHRLTLILHERQSGASSKVSHAVHILVSLTFDA